MTNETYEAIKGLGSCECYERWANSFKRLDEEEADGRFTECMRYVAHPLFKNIPEKAKKELYELLLKSLNRKRNPLVNEIPQEIKKLIELRFGK